MNEEVTVRWADQTDLGFLGQRTGLSKEVLMHKINAREIILLTINGNPVGQIQITFLWSEIPIIELIKIDDPFRNQGLSRTLLGFLEDNLREWGYDFLYSSSQVNEPSPQAWHHHMGFEVCGIINGINQGGIGEVFFRKAL